MLTFAVDMVGASNVLSDSTPLIASDPTETFGVRRVDTGEILLPAGTPWDHVGFGRYSISVDVPPGTTIEVGQKTLQNDKVQYFAVKRVTYLPPGYVSPTAVCTIPITENGNPIAGVMAWVTLDALGSQLVAGPLPTDTNGDARFPLVNGQSYFLFATGATIAPIVARPFTAVLDS